MRRLTMTLTAAMLVLGTMTASAQTQAPGAASFLAQLKNMTPIVKQAACNGRTGRCGCGPGFVSACGAYRCCRCVPC
jgi:hypothetical protein